MTRKLDHHASFISGADPTRVAAESHDGLVVASVAGDPVERAKDRDRLIEILHGRIPDRIPVCETAFWSDTIKRWEGEGMPSELRTRSDIGAYLGTDVRVSVGYGNTLRLTPEVVEENEEYVVWWDSNGILSKAFKESVSIPQRLDARIKTKDDWLQVRDRLVATRDRFGQDTIDRYHRMRHAGHCVFYLPGEPCWRVLTMMDEIAGLMGIAQDPDWIEDMIRSYTDMAIGVHEFMRAEGLVFDGVWMSGDLGYKSGLLFSPKAFRRILLPYHKKLANYFSEYDMPIVWHCDGYVSDAIPLAIEAGIACMNPLEVRNGNDIRVYKERFGLQMMYWGGINADVMATTREVIEEEIRSKCPVAMQGGGYILSSDHSIAPTISWDNFNFTIETMRKYSIY